MPDILAGIVIALILIGLLVLPMLMPSPMGGGGPPRQGGASPLARDSSELRKSKLQHSRMPRVQRVQPENSRNASDEAEK